MKIKSKEASAFDGDVFPEWQKIAADCAAERSDTPPAGGPLKEVATNAPTMKEAIDTMLGRTPKKDPLGSDALYGQCAPDKTFAVKTPDDAPKEPTPTCGDVRNYWDPNTQITRVAKCDRPVGHLSDHHNDSHVLMWSQKKTTPTEPTPAARNANGNPETPSSWQPNWDAIKADERLAIAKLRVVELEEQLKRAEQEQFDMYVGLTELFYSTIREQESRSGFTLELAVRKKIEAAYEVTQRVSKK